VLGPTALGLLAVGLAALGIWSAGALAGGTSTNKGTISLRNTDLGKVLVSSKGRTLYLFLKDRNGKSACAGMCAQYWPPLVARGKPTAGAGVKAAWLATVKRADGRMQVSYRRHPLYAFSLDKRAGQTTGEGMSAFGGKWYAVSSSGAAVRKAAPVGSTSTTTTTTPYPNPYP
jgi:predicted lipoprotein with Yx(FWY)xxD motif